MNEDVRPDVVGSLLDIMRKLLGDLDELGDPTPDQLDAARSTRFAAERALSALSDLAVAINTHICATSGRDVEGRAATFDAVIELGAVPAELGSSLRASVGLRDAIADTAGGIDRTALALELPLNRMDFRDYVSAIEQWLDGRSTPSDPVTP